MRGHENNVNGRDDIELFITPFRIQPTTLTINIKTSILSPEKPRLGCGQADSSFHQCGEDEG